MIEKIENPSREIFEKYILNNKPFIISNVVSNWECYKKWIPNLNIHENNKDYLSQMIRNKKISVRENVDFNSNEWLGTTKEIDFQEFWELWKDHYIGFKKQKENCTKRKPKYYLASLPIKTYFKELEGDYEIPEIPKEQNKSGNLWIGFKDQITPLHHDWSTGDPGMDGLHAIIIGKKLFRLFDPVINVKCFKRKNEWGQFHHSEFDLDRPNYQLYPEAINAKSIDIELNQGEMLYIPKLWWHYVKTLEPSISINFWFQHIGSEFLKCNLLWCHMEEYLNAVYNMSINQFSIDKIKSILKYLSDGKFNDSNLTNEQIEQFKLDPFQIMKFPKFINSFTNAVNNPLFKNHPKRDQFKIEILNLVNNWIKKKEIERNNN